jgi:hypothetical protein|tara:strand:- start:385 stop:549 length:165 start_codon:yes stop_codon:yes gene_type:complete
MVERVSGRINEGSAVARTTKEIETVTTTETETTTISSSNATNLSTTHQNTMILY